MAALLPREWQLRLVDVNTRPLSESDWQWGELVLLTGMLAQREEDPREPEGSGKPLMTSSPVPRFDLIRPSDYITMCIQTSRGCPFNCEFCDVVSLYGRKPL